MSKYGKMFVSKAWFLNLFWYTMWKRLHATQINVLCILHRDYGREHKVGTYFWNTKYNIVGPDKWINWVLR